MAQATPIPPAIAMAAMTTTETTPSDLRTLWSPVRRLRRLRARLAMTSRMPVRQRAQVRCPRLGTTLQGLRLPCRAVTFDEALGALLAMVGEQVGVDVLDSGPNPQLVASFGGVLRAGYSMTGGDPSEQESIYIRLESGDSPAALSLNRELFRDAMVLPDGSLSIRLGGVALLVTRGQTP